MLKQIFYPCLFFGFLSIFLPSTEARHIIGGHLQYECTGLESYSVEATLYRDCAGTGANFDDPAFFAVYRTDGTTSSLIQNLVVELGSFTDLSFAEAPCLIPPTTSCVQEGKYFFNLTLPVATSSYTIVYQRCCRNGFLNNIVAPDETGMTLSIEILPEAQGTCNSSPATSSFTANLACVNSPMSIDHTVIDVDGDELVYEFCSPRKGGGLGGSAGGPTGSDPSACDGVAPNPPCSPPYEAVEFILPDFSPLAPMGGNPVVDIDPVLGIMEGIPTIIGQYVYGVCIKEYRNGVLLSITHKDLQIGITDCNQSIPPPKLEHGLVEGNEVKVFTCGEEEWQFLITSFTEAFVDNIRWEIVVDSMGTMVTSTEWSPIFNFSGMGIFSGQLIINEGLACESIFPITVSTEEDCSVLSVKPTFGLSAISIFPNPVTDFLNISYPEYSSPDKISIRVLNFQGQELLTYPVGLTQIETKTWPEGIYILEFKTKEGARLTSRIVVNNQ